MNLSNLENGIPFTVSTAAEGGSDWSDLAELSNGRTVHVWHDGGDKDGSAAGITGGVEEMNNFCYLTALLSFRYFSRYPSAQPINNFISLLALEFINAVSLKIISFPKILYPAIQLLDFIRHRFKCSKPSFITCSFKH